MFKKWLISNRKRYLIIFSCLLLFIARLIWPELKFDTLDICLIAIVVSLFIIPSPGVFAPFFQRIKRIKVWQILEVELDSVENKAEKVEEPITNITVLSAIKPTSNEKK